MPDNTVTPGMNGSAWAYKSSDVAVSCQAQIHLRIQSIGLLDLLCSIMLFSIVALSALCAPFVAASSISGDSSF